MTVRALALIEPVLFYLIDDGLLSRHIRDDVYGLLVVVFHLWNNKIVHVLIVVTIPASFHFYILLTILFNTLTIHI